MSSKDTLGAPDEARESAEQADERDDDSLATKLSKELSNWRRQRNVSRPKRPDNNASNNSSEPARTIKVRGHETLVVRKPKMVQKPPSNSASESE